MENVTENIPETAMTIKYNLRKRERERAEFHYKFTLTMHQIVTKVLVDK